MPENHDAKKSLTQKTLSKSTTDIFLIIEEIRRKDGDRVIVLQKKLHFKTLYHI